MSEPEIQQEAQAYFWQAWAKREKGVDLESHINGCLRAALAAVAPLIRADERERGAQPVPGVRCEDAWPDMTPI